LYFLNIINCEFQEKFILNNFNKVIERISIKKSIFKSKFTIINNYFIKHVSIYDSNFINIFDIHSTKFNNFFVYKSIFEDYIGFEQCTFGFGVRSEKSKTTKFMYTTFKSIANFRYTTFNNGLDIETVNFKEVPNFFNTSIEDNIINKNTNRETFRIIKNSFDKVGNSIEANRFFALEMQKYKDELKDSDDKHGLFIFNWSDRLSSFGQNYKKPIYWLFGLILVLACLTKGHDSNLMYKIHPYFSEYFEPFSKFLNGIAKSFLPFKKSLIEGMEFISLLFYIIFMILIWQIIVAVKRHTKR
jgi:hypothetical protein